MKKELFCGIDVSKDKLDICFVTSNKNVKPVFEQLPNNKEVIKAYFLSYTKDDILIVFEPTSNYHLNLQIVLSELKLRYSLLHPTKSSLFLRHLSHIKNDIKDAQGLAIYALTFKSELNPSRYNKEYVLIKSYSSSLNLLSKLSTQLKNFIHSQKVASDEFLLNAIKELERSIDKLKVQIEKQAYKILTLFIPQTETILKESKGIGIQLALNLFPSLYFNRDKTDKQFISYLGLSPRIFQSGSSVNLKQHINKFGNTTTRKILFLSALNCIRFNEYFKLRYERLIQNGKNKKVAIIAVMCAIIRYLKSFFKFDENFKMDLV